MQLWQVPVMCSNRSVHRSFQFSPPSFERPRGPQISSPRHKAQLSLLGHSAGSIGSLGRLVHLRCCCLRRFLFAKSVSRSLRSQPGSLARGRARFCKHPIVSLCRLQTRMPGGRIHPRKARAKDNRAVRPISNFVRTNSAAAWAAAGELVP